MYMSSCITILSCLFCWFLCIPLVYASAIDNELCADVQVLYPTSHSLVDENQDPTAYVVIRKERIFSPKILIGSAFFFFYSLGNQHTSLSYLKTILVHKQKKNGWYLSKQIWNDAQDQEHKRLAQVTAVQYNLDELKTDLPDQYWYR
ncbi:uncharacterized protein BX664DRAFT_322002 [Halteromyces radiatus]|uniref:uncharacterized protein n=1 Tax=Halteromyces radiatus TaxID=101107 RepID=UPI00221F9C68|nr:uncharacterized protein BX664DRAFT_322002 [Halteromyces radiatus]KAI8099732.1 hypothetical protein BX664DRAFT_322002 [Halteromyces radiatus]